MVSRHSFAEKSTYDASRDRVAVGYYSILDHQFWTGHTGREIRRLGGPSAQILALYSFSNAYMNMLGLYRLRERDAIDDTGLTKSAFAKSLLILAETSFAFYDPNSSFLWVKEMARFRLGIKHEHPLEKNDNRTIAAQKMFASLPPNPWTSPFYERYHTLLHLKKYKWSNFPQSINSISTGFQQVDTGISPVLVSGQPQDIVTPGKTLVPSKGLRRGFEGASKPVITVRSGRTRKKNSAAAGASSPPTMKILTKLAHQVIDEIGLSSIADAKDRLKSLAAQHRIATTPEMFGAALDSANVQQERRRRGLR